MTQTILDYKPYVISQADKEPIFLAAIRLAVRHHFDHCPQYQNLCQNQGFDPAGEYQLADIPYLPVTTFKKHDLRSVPDDEIIRTLYSSSTSGQPSKISLDKKTSDSQQRALANILTDFMGQRRHFIILDAEATAGSNNGELASRSTAIRGMLLLSKSISFVLNDSLEIDFVRLQKAVNRIPAGEPICFFGFTWLVYQVYQKNKNNKELARLLKKLKTTDRIVLHIGGWKKLKDLAVSKADFNNGISSFLATDSGKIIDVYGMTEQLGTVYPDCPAGHKHAPVYSEIIIRDPVSLQPLPAGQVGFIQLLSPLPESYPGISVLSDDMGRIVGVDDCPCGRKGKYFVFEKRSETAEVRGCGDTLKV